MNLAVLKPDRTETSLILTLVSVPSGWLWGLKYADAPAVWIPAVVAMSGLCALGLVLARRGLRREASGDKPRKLAYLAMALSALAVGFMLLSWAFILMVSGGDLIGLSELMTAD
jgi:hypothetical protein